MKIAFEIQPLTGGLKTGVGYNEHGIISDMILKHPEDEYYLQYFSFRNTEEKRRNAEIYLRDNVRICVNRFMPGFIYRLVSSLAPFPYSWFFGKSAQVTHFFNFVIPPLVKGKRVVTIHDMAFKRFPETIRAKTKYMLMSSLKKTVKRADRIITVSEFSKKEILSFYNVAEEKITVIPNGVETEIFNPDIEPDVIDNAKRRYGVKDRYLLYLGTIEPRKNIERLIRAYKNALGFCDLPQLVIAGGNGWLYEGIYEKAAALELGDKLLFIGYVEDELRPAIIAGAHAFCFPSLYEGFGMPPLEAMACGTPVLTSNTASLPEVAGDAAVLVDPFSVEDITEGLVKICSDNALRAELKKKGLERAAMFNWEKLSEQTHQVYAELLDEKD